MPTAEQNAKIQDIADRLGVPFEWLYNVIRHESGFNPTIKNPDPRSSARGLIQVTDDTAKTVFKVFTSKALIGRYPDFISQMEYVVYPYFKYWYDYHKGNVWDTEQSFYLTVFYPAWANKPLDTSLPADVRSYNPGIDTLGDYVSRAMGTGGSSPSGGTFSPNPKFPTLFLLVGVGVTAYYLYKMSKKYPIALPAY